jgi:hypothetical protein
MSTTIPLVRFPGRRLVLASAWYDLLVTVPFAAPWTAKLFLSSLSALHAALGVGGAPMPAFEPTHLFFLGLLGSTVTMWSVIRLIRPSAFLGRADGFNRLAFSAWMVWALAQGASHLLAGFLVAELSWGVLQLSVLSVQRAPSPNRQPEPAHSG